MPLSNSIESYEDVRIILDKALETERGIAFNRSTRGQAVSWRHRAYKFRTLDRERNRKLLSPDSPGYGTSVYDGLFINVEDNRIEVRKLSTEELTMEIEEL